MVYIDNTKPIFMKGSLTYYPHPFNKSIDIKPTNDSKGVIRVNIRDLARLQQISKHTTMRFVKFDPDLAIILARGAVPLNFSIIHRFLKEKNEHNYNHDKYLNGETFHLFPGLERIWEGMDDDLINDTCNKNPYDKAKQYFLREMEEFINFRFKHLESIKVFYLDTTNTGRTLNQTLYALKELAAITNKVILLDVHGVLNKKGNKLAQTKNKDNTNIRIILPSKCKKIPYEGQSFGKVKISSWHFYPVNDLFLEDLSDVLAADIVNGYLVKYNVFRDIVYLNDYGDEIAGSTSCDVISKRIIFELAEWGPKISNRKSHLNLAKQKKDEVYSSMPMEEILKRLDPKK